MATRTNTRTPTNAKTAKGRQVVSPRSRSAVARAFEGRGYDIWGVVLVALGVLSALGMYANAAGAAGRLISSAAGGTFGVLGHAVPLLAVAGGIATIRYARADAQPTNSPARVVVGSVIITVGLTGLVHLYRGQPAMSDGVSQLSQAGGLVGLLSGGTTEALASIVGATLILLTVVTIGVLVATHTSAAAAAAKAIAGARAMWGVVLKLWHQLLGVNVVTEDDGRVASNEATDPTVVGNARFSNGDDERMPRGWGDSAPTLVVGGETFEDPTIVENAASTAEASALFDQDSYKSKVPHEEQAPTSASMPVASPINNIAGVGRPEVAVGSIEQVSSWQLPPDSVLRNADPHVVDRQAVERTGRVLEQALAEHGVETRLVGMVVGPTVTRYELELGAGVKVARVTSLHKDIAYAMASADVRILAPIPGRQAIGVEVPNAKREIVALGDLLSSAEAEKATHPLEVAIGRDINGVSVMANLAQMPHVLIAGATGAGKSSCINSIITSMLMRSTPDDVRMILIDPKRVELTQYSNLPHLLTEVVTDPKKAANALDWAVREMDRRYEVLEAVGVRDITGYNKAYDQGKLASAPGAGQIGIDGTVGEYERLPFIVIVVDELNDLMMVAARDVEASICRIAQKARAVGIHLVLATQRPSVNVITGLIKANIPSRIAFAVSSLADSRVILDQAGAERLIGKGDMLMLTANSSAAHRVQGAWVTEKEVRDVADAWLSQAPEVVYTEDVQGEAEAAASAGALLPGGSSGDDDDDELLLQAIELIVRSQLGSTSMLQRKLRVGFARAGRLMDLLEQRGVVGPSEGSKPRTVLMTPEELDAALAGGSD